MSNQFCTSCGHSAAIDAKFCENCGAVFLENTSAPQQDILVDTPPETTVATSRETAIEKTRSVLNTWIMPFNATLVFGSTLVAVFDFLSPRVALLPIAATVAVAGLLTTLALRKYAAPSLPEGNVLRRALAPEMNLHKSPLLLVTGVLSALMVSGAAWSNAASASGGVIASKFDAARNAQMQLGVMQGLQKEQRVQTAVLEDIRDGRTLNPRRELANQGILWTNSDFSSAIFRGDKTVVSLFLSGGMKWDLGDAKAAKSLDTDAILSLLLDNTQLLEKKDECWSTIVEVSYNKVYALRKNLKREPQRVPRLSPIEIRLMKAFCTKPADLTYLLEEIPREEAFFAEKIDEARKTAATLAPIPGTTRTFEECKSDLSMANGKIIQSALSNYVITKARPVYGLEGAFNPGAVYALAPGELLLNKAKSNGSFVLDSNGKAEIEAYCKQPYALESSFDNFESEMLKQVAEILQ